MASMAMLNNQRVSFSGWNLCHESTVLNILPNWGVSQIGDFKLSSNREARGYEVSPILGPHQMDPNRLGVAETWYSNHK